MDIIDLIRIYEAGNTALELPLELIDQINNDPASLVHDVLLYYKQRCYDFFPLNKTPSSEKSARELFQEVSTDSEKAVLSLYLLKYHHRITQKLVEFILAGIEV